MSRKIDRIRTALETLHPEHLELLDESHLHSRGLETHYKAVMVSPVFAGQRAVRRHQQIYRTLGDLMDEIHALALHAYTPDEWCMIGNAPASPRCRGGGKQDAAVAT